MLKLLPFNLWRRSLRLFPSFRHRRRFDAGLHARHFHGRLLPFLALFGLCRGSLCLPRFVFLGAILRRGGIAAFGQGIRALRHAVGAFGRGIGAFGFVFFGFFSAHFDWRWAGGGRLVGARARIGRGARALGWRGAVFFGFFVFFAGFVFHFHLDCSNYLYQFCILCE